jgi:hypothetical protein
MKTFSCAICLFSSILPGSALAHAGQILSEMPCPVEEPMGLAPQGEFLWISDLASRDLVKIQSQDASVVERLPATGNMPTGLAWHGEVLFAADRASSQIERRRPGESDLSPIPYYEKSPAGIVHDGQHLWVVGAHSAKIHQIDPVDGTTLRSFPATASAPTGIAFDGRSLWVADHKTDRSIGSTGAMARSPSRSPPRAPIRARSRSLGVCSGSQTTSHASSTGSPYPTGPLTSKTRSERPGSPTRSPTGSGERAGSWA